VSNVLFKRAVLVALTAVLLTGAACGDASGPPAAVDTPSPPLSSATPLGTCVVCKPQNRAMIGDVETAFARYEATRKDRIDFYKSQPWYRDGLSREEALFVERGLTFVARYDGPRTAYVGDETIRDKLYLYEKFPAEKGPIELLLIYELGQRAEQEMALLKRTIPLLESIVGVEYPARIMTVINGRFEVNDFNESEFIRIARCCTQAASVLAHEVAHTYWSVGPSWFNEGMADIYSVILLERMNADPPPGWRGFGATLDAFYRSRKSQVEGGRFPNMTLARRFAQDGLYEVASVFLLDIRQAIGEEAFAAAVRDIYLASDFGRYNLSEKRIQDFFLERADALARPEVMALFNRHVWGDNGERYQRLKELDAP
jgi:hypothetical protein